MEFATYGALNGITAAPAMHPLNIRANDFSCEIGSAQRGWMHATVCPENEGVVESTPNLADCQHRDSTPTGSPGISSRRPTKVRGSDFDVQLRALVHRDCDPAL